MTNYLMVLGLGVLLVMPGVVRGTTEEAQQTYEKGLLVESGDRNLPQAVSLYRAVLQMTGDPVLKSKAYLRIGLCEDQLGHTEEAKTALSVLLNEYPDRIEEVNTAKSILRRMEEDVQANVLTKAQEQSSSRTVEEIESRILQKINKQEKEPLQRIGLSFYGGASVPVGNMNQSWEESVVAGAEIDVNMLPWFSVGLNGGQSLEHKGKYTDIIPPYDYWDPISGAQISQSAYYAGSSMTTTQATIRLLFKPALSKNIRQIIGVGVGYYHFDATLRGKMHFYQSSGYPDYNYSSSNTSFDNSFTEDCEGYVFPFGWEFSQGHFSASLMAEYHYVNVEGPNNLTWLTPSFSLGYRFE